MATIVGSIATSHIPAIGGAIAKKKQQEPYWKPFFDGFPPARDWLAKVKPDIAVVFYNDHGLNFFLDKMPTFSIGAAPVYHNADEGWGIPTLAPHKGDEDLSWHLVEALNANEFDMTVCQEMLTDHAATLPLELLWPGEQCNVRIVPICINTVLFPLPSALRCYRLGQTVGRAIEAWDSDARVLILGSGGLSHQLEGKRAGFMNPEFDQVFMSKLVDDPLWVTRYSSHELVELTGTQGVELLNWVAMRGALTGRVSLVHQNYHIPISNTATGLMVLANG